MRIFTDSAADFEPYELERMNIECIPVLVYFGDKKYSENINLTKQEFYKLLNSEEAFPRTSQPSPYDFENALEKAKNSGDEAVVITISSALSGTFQGAVSAKKLLHYDNCYVVDSRTASGGERILAEQAVKMRDKGKNAEEIAACLTEISRKIVLYACMDTLEYLYRGGRVSHSVYTVGSVAHIKPVIVVSQNGCAQLQAKTLGIRRGMEYLFKRLKKDPPDNEFPIYIMYTCNQKSGLMLAEYLEKRGIRIPRNHIVNVGAAVGSHIGPDACGIVYVKA